MTLIWVLVLLVGGVGGNITPVAEFETHAQCRVAALTFTERKSENARRRYRTTPDAYCIQALRQR